MSFLYKLSFSFFEEVKPPMSLGLVRAKVFTASAVVNVILRLLKSCPSRRTSLTSQSEILVFSFSCFLIETLAYIQLLPFQWT